MAAACSSSNGDGAAARETGADGDPVAEAEALGCDRAAEVATDAGSSMPTGEQIFAWVEDLASFGYRRSGTEATRQAEAYIRCHFEEIGLVDVHFEESTTWQWEVDNSALSIEGEEVDAFPAHHSFVTLDEPSEFSTGPDGLTTGIVDVGDGSDIDPAEVEGKIVLFDLQFQVSSRMLMQLADFAWDPELTILDESESLDQANPYLTNLTEMVGELIEADAAGFVGVLGDYFDSNQYYNEYYRVLEMTIPGVWVSPTEGDQVRALLADADDPSATLTMEGERSEVSAQTVVGALPGRTDDTIMVQSHHDSTWDGGVQDASGAASVLALAHNFAGLPEEDREKTLLFTTFSSHWTGYQAHQDFLDVFVTNAEAPYNIVANVTVEHIGKHGIIDPETRELRLLDEPEPRGILHNVGVGLSEEIVGAIKEHDLQRTVVIRADEIGGMPTDASFIYDAGVPTISLISGPVYLYDAVDTVDLVAQDELQPVARAFADLIGVLDATPADEMRDDGTLGGLSPEEFDQRMGGQRGELLDAVPASGEGE